MTAATDQFEKAYKRLNPAQKIAVDTTEGPVLVMAGPGTGKTQVLAARIANILLKTDINPSNILALTFTDSAAKNMRERVVSMIGQAGYYVHITTFHSLCASIIANSPEYFPIDRASQPLTDIERYSIAQELILELPLDILKPINRPLFYLREVLQSISDLKREGVDVDEYAKLVEDELGQIPDDLKKSERMKLEKQQQKNRELVTLYRAYEERLRASLRYDFDDMISLVVGAFKQHDELLLEYQERFQYILVDEYQDTNTAQNLIVQQLASYWGEQANVFTVGDPHQSIYRFQGASVENMYSFLNQYPNALVVTLTEGYRCPQSIYNAAHQLIGNNSLTAVHDGQKTKELMEALSQKLNSANQLPAVPRTFQAPSQQLELVQIAEEVQQLIAQGVPQEEIAVLYRTNAEAAEIQQVLDRWEIPYEFDGASDVLQDEVINQLLEVCQVVLDLRDGDDAHQLFEVLCYPWLGLDNNWIFRLARTAGKNKQSIYRLIKSGYEEYSQLDSETSISQEDFQKIEELIASLEAWSTLDAQVTFPEWFESVINESGLLQWIKEQPEKISLLLNLNALFTEIKKLSRSGQQFKLAQFLNTVAVMREHNLSLQPEDLNVSEGAVQLATVHKAKGREWDYVYIVHCIDGKWGNRRNINLIPLPDSLLKFTDVSKKEQNEDERRLFYVALTRAKKQVTISYPQTIVAENRSQDVVASMFLLEIGEHSAQEPTEQLAFVDKEEEYLERLVATPVSRFSESAEKKFFRQLVEDFSLSVTALNNYLRDPEYFVTYNLLKVPQAQQPFLAYGTAMHAALEKLYRDFQIKQSLPPLGDVLAYYHGVLKHELMTEEEFERRLAKGKEVLTAYYEQVDQTIKPLEIEKFFGSGFAKTVLDGTTLVGRVDRIDWIDEQAKTTRVIDYKTGKIRSVGDIEGTTVAAGLSEREQALPEPVRGAYKRQLLFYKLLTELDPSFSQTVDQGVFEFVEPNQRTGKIVQRHFTLHQQDVDLLKELIREVMTELRSLQFLEKV